MSFAEILPEIPRLSCAERQEWVRNAIAVADAELTAEENARLDARMEDFRRQPDAGISLKELRESEFDPLPEKEREHCLRA